MEPQQSFPYRPHVDDLVVQITAQHGLLALAALYEIGREVEAQIRETVAEYRSEGSTWADIAEFLHITRQAAQQRFGVSSGPQSD